MVEPSRTRWLCRLARPSSTRPGKAAAELIGIKSMMRDMGWDADIKLHVDATVAQAMANRQGIGKIRHLDVRYLWLQEMAKSGVIAVRKMNKCVEPGRCAYQAHEFAFQEMLGKLGQCASE